MSGLLFVVSATLPDGPVDHPSGLRRDYASLSRALDATVLDYSQIERSRRARALAAVFGRAMAQAWLAFCRRDQHDAILTDGEHVGIPLALLLKLARAPVAHITIGHRLSVRKKRLFFRWLRVHTHITRLVLHSRLQHAIAVDELRIPSEKLALVPYQVDTEFWRPLPVAEERLVCSAGLEFRDYPTLFRAVEGLDAKVVIGAASNWSRRANSARGVDRPPNVEVGSFDYEALRSLYARAAVVAVPLDDTDFQAGVTTILEAMAMGKAVVVTHSSGQSDVVQDRRTVTRGVRPRPRVIGLLEEMALDANVALEPNGLYVLPGDHDALRRAIVYLLDHPDERARLGAAGRRTAEQLLTIEQFTDRMRSVIELACSTASAPSGIRARAALATAGPQCPTKRPTQC
jgi:glycosyltransferase involved in cell wall biosynthesis